MKFLTKASVFLAASTACFDAYAGTSLFTADGTQYQVDNLSNEVRKIAESIGKDMKEGGPDNFILYVHGRGKEPKKSLDEVIPALEKEYKAKVLMFHWFPSYKGPTGYPSKEAAAAAPDFLKVLENFQKFKDENADKVRDVKSTLLVHSMGNVVLQTMMESYNKNSLKKDLFDTVVLNSADVDAKGHDLWVKKIDFTNNLYITVNENDGILGLSAKRQQEKRLGQKLETMFGKDLPLADNANYVDFSDIEINHRYFLKNGQDDNPYLAEFYGAVMNGNSVNLNTFHGVQKVKNGNGNKIYIFKAE